MYIYIYIHETKRPIYNGVRNLGVKRKESRNEHINQETDI